MPGHSTQTENTKNISKPMAKMTLLEREAVRAGKGLFCQIDGCDRGTYAKGYCSKHWTRILRNGTIKKLYTKKTPIEVTDDVAILTLNNTRKATPIYAKISVSDVGIVERYKWVWSKRNGVVTLYDGTHIKLHRMLLQPPRDKVVDHINGDKLDNRRENLRIIEQWQNVVNQASRPMRNIESTPSGRYYVRMKANGVRHIIGSFDSLGRAIKARDEAAARIHGDIRQR